MAVNAKAFVPMVPTSLIEQHIEQRETILLQYHLCMTSMYYDQIIHILQSITHERSGTSAKCIQKRQIFR